jgi:hypothetical protein
MFIFKQLKVIHHFADTCHLYSEAQRECWAICSRVNGNGTIEGIEDHVSIFTYLEKLTGGKSVRERKSQLGGLSGDKQGEVTEVKKGVMHEKKVR